MLCAYGDATTRDAQRGVAHLRPPFSTTSTPRVHALLEELDDEGGRKTLDAEGVPRGDRRPAYQVDVRYHGQGLSSPST